MKNLISKDDDFLYNRLIDFLQEVKLVQGGNGLASTLRRHNKIREYMTEKQRQFICGLEDYYFDEHGLNLTAIQSQLIKNKSLLR